MSLYEAEEPLVPMASAPTPPRSWQAMLVTWAELMATLAAIVGEKGPALDADGLAAVIDRLNFLTWAWMWSQPPCSQARKAGFTLGAAAWLIDRWRTCISEVEFVPDDGFPLCVGHMVGKDDGKTPLQTTDEKARALPAAQAIGQLAETLLRNAAWYIDDARGEAHARTLGWPCEQCRAGVACSPSAVCAHPDPPAIPPHERVYERTGGGLVFVGQRGVALGLPWTAGILAHAILEDHKLSTFLGGQILKYRCDRAAMDKSFAALTIASLPDGPWVMTSRDARRFLDLFLEARLLAEAGT